MGAEACAGGDAGRRSLSTLNTNAVPKESKACSLFGLWPHHKPIKSESLRDSALASVFWKKHFTR